MDGDIIVFQKHEKDEEMYDLPTCKDYFRLVPLLFEIFRTKLVHRPIVRNKKCFCLWIIAWFLRRLEISRSRQRGRPKKCFASSNFAVSTSICSSIFSVSVLKNPNFYQGSLSSNGSHILRQDHTQRSRFHHGTLISDDLQPNGSSRLTTGPNRPITASIFQTPQVNSVFPLNKNSKNVRNLFNFIFSNRTGKFGFPVEYFCCSELAKILTSSYKAAPGSALKCTYDGTLKEILPHQSPKVPKKIFYQQLSIPVNELENKRPFKVNDL